MTSWKRTYGPAETYECGDVEYEMGSTYDSSDNHRATITYFVTVTAETPVPQYGVEYRMETYIIGEEDDSTVTYDWACNRIYYSLEEAIERCRACAAIDESEILSLPVTR